MYFRKEYAFLSNFYEFPKPIKLEGIEYKTVENFYQAMKTTDRTIRADIAKMSPSDAKRVGRFELELRPDWEQIKLQVMEYIVRKKFMIPELREKLLFIKEPIIEHNDYQDKYWGVDSRTGVGQNRLGQIIEKIKKEN